MRFWTSGETDKNIGHDIMKLLYLNIEPKINEYIKDKSYGSGLVEWAYMTISVKNDLLLSGFFKEIKKYRKKIKEVEFRLRIDNDSLSKACENEAYKLFCESILHSIDIAESEFNIKDFDFKTFREDLISLFQKEGWI